MILGLDCSTLVHRRQAAISAYKDLDFCDYEWEEELKNVLQRDKNGMYLPYCTVIASYIRDYKL